MAKVRKFVAYRKLERPYTRHSKFKNKSFVRAKPVCRVVRYDMGTDRKFEYTLNLRSKSALQIRDLAIESARQATNRHLEKRLTKNNYKLKIMIVPHHILRENPLAAGAGADRMSTGMAHSFGKPIGVAAQVRKGQKLVSISVDAPHLQLAKEIINKAKYKLPCSCTIEVVKNA